MIIKGTIVQSLTLNEVSIIENGGILLDKEGFVIDVLKTIPIDTKEEIIDYKDKLIMQSFSDMHLHAPQYPILGIGMDLPLLEWLDKYTFKTEAQFCDPIFARKIYRSLANKLIKNGTTRVSIFGSLHEKSSIILMEEFEKAGITGLVGKVNMDRNSPKELSETTKESIDSTIKFLEEAKKFKNIKPILTPRFTPSCSNELMSWLGKTAKEYDLGVQSHLSESIEEIAWVKKLHPDCSNYYDTYLKYGLWNNKTLMAHCVHSNEKERKAIKDYGVTIVHCADSNINLCSGICPLRIFLDEGVKVVLGSDIAGGSLLPMYKNIQQTIKTSKVFNIYNGKKMNFLSVNEAYYLATSAPQLYFNKGVGFAKKEKLHAIVVDDSSFPITTKNLSLQERFERAIYLMEEENIIAVYSEGKKVI